LISQIVKKAGPKGAAKLLAKGGVGALLSGSGIASAIGIGMSAWTAYEIANLLYSLND
jgi:hypothetical protein